MTGLASTVSRRCGTDGGYRRHRRDGQPPCGACLRAHEARRLDEVLSGGMRVRGVESLPLEARRHAALVACGAAVDPSLPAGVVSAGEVALARELLSALGLIEDEFRGGD